MLRRAAPLLTPALLLCAIATRAAETRAQAPSARLTRAVVSRLCAGPDARVELRLRGGAVLRGRISRIGEEGLVLDTGGRAGRRVEVPFGAVARVERRGRLDRREVIRRARAALAYDALD